MAPVARRLARDYGTLEPIQTAATLEGQVQELKSILESHGHPPVALIGFSWGAWLSLIVAARYPTLVKKLLLVACGPLEERYVSALRDTRLSRLSADEKTEYESVVQALDSPATSDRDPLLSWLHKLASKADTYDGLMDQRDESDRLDRQGSVFQGVWDAAARLRSRGDLIGFAQDIQCPVIAIHGDYDPHPAAGVEEPLSGVLRDFRFVLLERCGHTPWMERQARERFYDILRAELL